MVDLCKTADAYSGATGAMPMLYSIRDCVPIAYPSILVGIFFILFAGNYFFIKGRTGRAKVFVALLGSCFFTLVLSMFAALATLITYKGVLFWGFMTIFSFILLVVSDKQ